MGLSHEWEWQILGLPPFLPPSLLPLPPSPSLLPPSLIPSPSVQLRVSEMELNKAQNLIDHKQEIFSRPPRTWIAKQDLTAAGSGTYTTFFSECLADRQPAMTQQASLVPTPGAAAPEAHPSAVLHKEKVSRKRKAPSAVSAKPESTAIMLCCCCFLSLCVCVVRRPCTMS